MQHSTLTSRASNSLKKVNLFFLLCVTIIFKCNQSTVSTGPISVLCTFLLVRIVSQGPSQGAEPTTRDGEGSAQFQKAFPQHITLLAFPKFDYIRALKIISIFWHIYLSVFLICNLDSLSVLRIEILSKVPTKFIFFL